MADPATITVTAEDGSGNPDANVYATIAFIDKYHADRGNARWSTVGAEDKKSCAIKATDYIDKRFARKFRGFRRAKEQGLAWPRLNAQDSDGYMLDGVPVQLQKATAEYSLRAAIYNVLAPDPIRPVPSQDMTLADPNGDQTSVVVGPVRSRKEVVGPLEETVTYDSSKALADAAKNGSRMTQSNVVNDWIIPEYPEADLLIEDLLANRGSSISLERA